MALAYKLRKASRHIQVERAERDVHAAEKGDDFVDQFHVGIPFLSELIM